MRRAFRLVLAIGCVASACGAIIHACEWDYPIWPKDKHSDTKLFRFVVDGKLGYIDAAGKVVIPAQFRAFGNWGFDDFFEGVATLGVWTTGFIDSSGKPISFGPYVVRGGRFSEGAIAAAESKEKSSKMGFVDHRGKLLIGFNFDGVRAFSEGLAAIKTGARWGYIDHSGKTVIDPRFYLAEEFAEGVARVIERAPCNYVGHDPCAFANPKVLGFQEYKSGVSMLYPACQYSFVNERGVRLFPQTFPDAYDFSDGLAPVRQGQLWGYIDKTGVFRIQPRFQIARSFSEGLAAVYQDGKFGFIDHEGRFVIPAQFAQAEEFSEGAAVVGKQHEKVWFIDKTGNQLFRRDFTAASDFRLGLAHVRIGKEFQYINRAGTVVFRYRERN